MTGRTSKADARREEILKAAGACFGEKGLQGASINDICRALNISPGHLYYYFKSKDAIIEALLDHMRQSQLLNIEHSFKAGESLVAFFLSGDYLRRVEQPPSDYLSEATIWELYAEAARNRSGHIAEMVRDHWGSADRVFLAGIEAAKAAGELRPDTDSNLLLTLILMIVVSGSMAHFGDPEYDPERYLSATRYLFEPFLAKGYAVSTQSGRRQA